MRTPEPGPGPQTVVKNLTDYSEMHAELDRLKKAGYTLGKELDALTAGGAEKAVTVLKAEAAATGQDAVIIQFGYDYMLWIKK